MQECTIGAGASLVASFRVMPDALLFDLDGTLIDSIELIMRSMRHAFDGYAAPAPTDAEWRALIGRPLVDSFREFVTEEADVERLIGRYREYQLEHHDRLVRPYEGIVAEGHPMALVTSKADWLAVRALVHVGLDAAIPVVVGCDSCTRHKPHPEPVERALALLRSAPEGAIFVGDSPHDMESGRAAGVRTIGVAWGAATRDELANAGADLVVREVEQLPAAVRQMAARSP
jgi:pyrophosphatase PpaX